MLTSVPVNNGTTFCTVTFAPHSQGFKTAMLKVVNNDIDEGEFSIRLEGQGTPRPPDSMLGIPHQQVRIGSPLSIDLSSYFDGPDTPISSYALESNSHPAAVTATLTNTSLQLTGVIPGSTMITVRAADSLGTSTTFSFRVNAVTTFTLPGTLPALFLNLPVPRARGAFQLTINSIPGRRYQLAYSDNLTTWIVVPGSILAGADRLQWMDRNPPAAVGSKRFYRATEIPSL